MLIFFLVFNSISVKWTKINVQITKMDLRISKKIDIFYLDHNALIFILKKNNFVTDIFFCVLKKTI